MRRFLSLFLVLTLVVMAPLSAAMPVDKAVGDGSVMHQGDTMMGAACKHHQQGDESDNLSMEQCDHSHCASCVVAMISSYSGGEPVVDAVEFSYQSIPIEHLSIPLKRPPQG